MKQIIIDISIIENLFPFSFVTDSAGKIVRLAPTIKKLIGETFEEQTFEKLFLVQRPAAADHFKIIDESIGEMVVLKMISPAAELMGQIMKLPENDSYLFIMNLVVQDADELTTLKLDFNDFAIQDPIFDYLMLLQTQRRAIKQAEVLNKKLEESTRIAVKASETKSQFLANMSHELRTPMNGLLGMASILQDTKLDTEQQDYVQTLMSSGEAMLALVNDILDLSKIESGFIYLEPSSFKLDEFVQDIFSTLLPMAQKKNLNLKFSVSSKAPLNLITDKGRLRQIILNLAGNAIKFTSTGFVDIQISTVFNSIAEKELSLAVRDSGIGMNAETLTQIFSPFVQGDNSMTRKFEGTGLGLSICKKLVEALDGSITVKSVEGKGSEFKVNLKLQSQEDSASRQEGLTLTSSNKTSNSEEAS